MSNKKKNNNYATDKTAVAKQQEKKAKSSKKAKGIIKQVLLITLAVLLIGGVITGFVFLMRACSKTPEMPEYQSPTAGVFRESHVVEIKVKGYDNVIEIVLYRDEAHKTVDFLVNALASSKYEGKEINISTSASNKYVTITNGEEGNVKGEFYDNNGSTQNNISHVAGVITMHKTGAAQSSGYDFDILLAADASKNGTQAAVGFVKEVEDLEFIQKLVDEYRASKTVTSTTTSTEIFFGTNSSIKVTADELATEHKTIDRTFIPKTTGTYKFKSSEFVSLAITENGVKLTPVDAAAKLADGIEYELYADREYTVTLGVEGLKANTSYKVIISGEVFQNGDNTVTFPKVETSTDTSTNTSTGETTTREETYKFTAHANATYIFKSKDSKVKITVIDGDKTVGEAGTEVKVALEAGKTYDIYMTTTDKAATSYVVSITEKVVYAGNNTITIVSADKASGVTYTEYVFAAEKTGTYKFDLLSNSGSTLSNAKKVAIYKGETLVGEKYAYLVKGEVYTVRVMTESLASGTSYRVVVKEPVLSVGQNEVIITKNEAGKDDKGNAVAGKNTAVQYFTPSVDGKHVFGCTDLDFEVEIWDGDTKLGTKQADLVKDKQYTIKLVGKEVSGEPNKLVQGKFYYITVQQPVLTVSTNEIEVVDTEATFTFETASGAIYSIKEKDNALKDGKIEIFDEDGTKIEQDLDYIVLEKGVKYQIKITKPEGSDGNFSIVIDEALPIIESVTVREK